MKRALKHSWEPQEGTGKLKHFKCRKKGCTCEKYWDSDLQRTIFTYKWTWLYSTPRCEGV